MSLTGFFTGCLQGLNELFLYITYFRTEYNAWWHVCLSVDMMQQRFRGSRENEFENTKACVTLTEEAICDLSFPQRQDPGPGEAEAEHLHAQELHRLDVLRILVVEVACSVAGVSIVSLARRVGKNVPNAGFAAILVD